MCPAELISRTDYFGIPLSGIRPSTIVALKVTQGGIEHRETGYVLLPGSRVRVPAGVWVTLQPDPEISQKITVRSACDAALLTDDHDWYEVLEGGSAHTWDGLTIVGGTDGEIDAYPVSDSTLT